MFELISVTSHLLQFSLLFCNFLDHFIVSHYLYFGIFISCPFQKNIRSQNFTYALEKFFSGSARPTLKFIGLKLAW